LDAVDFEARAWIPHSGWPISKADLDPFYENAAAVTHLTSKEWAVEEWQRRDNSPVLALGDGFVTRVAQSVPSELRSFGQTYRDDIARADNMTAYLNANAVEVEVDEGATRATTVRVATLAGKTFSVAAKWFILALGGLENPRLLLASDRHQRTGLGNQNGLVGRFFLEHPRFTGGMVLAADSQLRVGFYQPHRVGNAAILGYLALSDALKRAEELVDVQIRIDPIYDAPFAEALASEDVASARALAKIVTRGQRVSQGQDIGNIGEHVGNVVRDLMSWRTFTIPGAPLPVPYPEVVGELMGSTSSEAQSLIPQLLGDISGSVYRKLSGRVPLEALALSTRFEPVPNRDSRLFLIRERDALGMRKVQLDWRLSDLDRHSVRRTLEILAVQMGRIGLGRLRVLFDEEGPWPDDLAGGWHHMGTTRMSSSAKEGVVDKNCRVHGMSNLYVAGSSVFPTAGSGTPTLTIVALALRLAQHLKRMLT
jgi:choline dehydrogenase-like flavoprotein